MVGTDRRAVRLVGTGGRKRLRTTRRVVPTFASFRRFELKIALVLPILRGAGIGNVFVGL